jgi:hypothetical protein
MADMSAMDSADDRNIGGGCGELEPWGAFFLEFYFFRDFFCFRMRSA